jgi:hypothetical protein
VVHLQPQGFKVIAAELAARASVSERKSFGVNRVELLDAFSTNYSKNR